VRRPIWEGTNNKIRVIQIPNQRAERISSTEFRLLDDEKLTFRVGDTEYDPENIPSLGPRKQGYGFIRPGEEVNLFHEEDQTYEIVKVVECDVNTIRGRTSVQLTDEFGRTALQLVEDSLLHPRNYTAFANARSRNIDDIGTKWNGVMPTKMPTNPRILGPQDMEMYTREYLDEDWMQSQRLGDSAEHAPLAANRRHSFKGQVLDFWGDPVKDPLTESAKPEVYRIPDPFMTYVYGTVDYPPPEKLGKETEDPFVYEEQFNVQGGQIHATEAELDPDKYADIIEEHAKNHPYLRLGWSEMTDRPDELQKKSMLPPIPKSLPIDSIVDLYKKEIGNGTFDVPRKLDFASPDPLNQRLYERGLGQVSSSPVYDAFRQQEDSRRNKHPEILGDAYQKGAKPTDTYGPPRPPNYVEDDAHNDWGGTYDYDQAREPYQGMRL